MNRRLAIGLSLAAIVAVALWLRHHFAPEQVIRRQFLAAVASFEREELLPLMAALDRSYSDPWGQRYESLAGVFRELFETFESLEVSLERPRISVDGTHAQLTLSFIVWGTAEGTRGYVVGSLSQPCSATIGWIEKPQGWRISTTEELDIPELRAELEAARSQD